MKRTLILLLIVGLVGGSIVGPAAAKKKKKKPKQTPVTFFLRRDDCGGDNDNTHLSMMDGADVACASIDAGILYDVVAELGTEIWTAFPATDGVPLTLDATQPLTGEITLYGADCAVSGACSPAGVSAGNAVFKVRLIGETGGEEHELGAFEETFTTLPGEPHTISVSIELDPAFDKQVFDALRLETYQGGQAIGPHGISYDDPASFVVVPAWVKPGAIPATPAVPATP